MRCTGLAMGAPLWPAGAGAAPWRGAMAPTGAQQHQPAQPPARCCKLEATSWALCATRDAGPAELSPRAESFVAQPLAAGRLGELPATIHTCF